MSSRVVGLFAASTNPTAKVPSYDPSALARVVVRCPAESMPLTVKWLRTSW